MSALDKSFEQAVLRKMVENEVREAHRPSCGPQIRCLKCQSVIQSKFRHDFTTCSCGDVSIDGGGAYTKISAADESRWEYVNEEPPPAA